MLRSVKFKFLRGIIIHAKIFNVRMIEISADQLVPNLLSVSEGQKVCVLDSCRVGKPGANLLIAGIDPVAVCEITRDDPNETCRIFDEKLGTTNLAAIFTISYDFGLKLQGIERQPGRIISSREPDIYLALFDCLVIHNYENGRTFLSGNAEKFDQILDALIDFPTPDKPTPTAPDAIVTVRSNFTKPDYLKAVDEIKELIRSGETYQTNLTQQLSVELSAGLTASEIFLSLRKNHPAPFSAFIDRGSSTVVSASPERFFQIQQCRSPHEVRAPSNHSITASPIKGTRRRGTTVAEDERLRAELLGSEKDRAENTMIVDLMRNDLGRICEYGSVKVDSLCELEAHPTLFHLVSTVSGTLREETTFSDIIKAVFPCGSITGAPKIRTMRIIEEIENINRGLSMGAIGCRIPEASFALPSAFEMSVAIRTMVIRDGTARFNVGGGIVIDSDSESEYDESMLKARALLRALSTRPSNS